MQFDLSDGTIPLLTTKKMHIPSIIHELLWYISGSGNIKYLQDNGVRIWNEWADENGDLGPVYGYQWRHAPKLHLGVVIGEVDQLAEVINKLKTNPTDRRLIINSWNVGQLHDMKLPPCHYTFQFYVDDDNRLCCKMTQRSCDLFLGVPFNIVQYSILTRMVAQVVGLQPGTFIWDGGDVHIYTNHFDQVKEQLRRYPAPSPTLKLNPSITNIDDFKYEDFEICNYDPQSAIKATVAV
jgi:thymidylate synthase